jgi:1-acyl-sn-glycerol-3-phosphate acyltransferase
LVTQDRSFDPEYRYPRRRVIRFLLRRLIDAAFAVLSDLQIVGADNLPKAGPLIVVANHFHFADGVAIIRATPWPLEYLAASQPQDAPWTLKWVPRTWGAYYVRRGAASRSAMRAALSVLAQNGVVGMFPEGGSWAPVLRPARPGTAYLAARTGAPLLPIGLDGLVDLFPSLCRGRRATVTMRIGQAFGPFRIEGRGPARREQLNGIGDEIMRHIAALLPPERQGVYSSDSVIRAAAQGMAEYPYHDLH